MAFLMQQYLLSNWFISEDPFFVNVSAHIVWVNLFCSCVCVFPWLELGTHDDSGWNLNSNLAHVFVSFRLTFVIYEFWFSSCVTEKFDIRCTFFLSNLCYICKSISHSVALLISINWFLASHRRLWPKTFRPNKEITQGSEFNFILDYDGLDTHSKIVISVPQSVVCHQFSST